MESASHTVLAVCDPRSPAQIIPVSPALDRMCWDFVEMEWERKDGGGREAGATAGADVGKRLASSGEFPFVLPAGTEYKTNGF